MSQNYHDNLDLARAMPGYEYLWICAICLVNAKSGVLLQFQFIDLDHKSFVFFDSDDTPWLFCPNCMHKFHLKCVTCLSTEELLATGSFYCCIH